MMKAQKRNSQSLFLSTSSKILSQTSSTFSLAPESPGVLILWMIWNDLDVSYRVYITHTF